MFSYIDDILSTFDTEDPNLKVMKSIAAPNNLFLVNKDCKKFHQVKVVEFHNIVTKNLYAIKRSRPDTFTAISFLSTMVQSTNKENWDKLVHLM